MAGKIKSIGLITPNYPSARSIERGAFVEALVRQWRQMGVGVDVVAPVSLPNWARDLKRSVQDGPQLDERVASPLYPTFSTVSLGPVDMKEVNRRLFAKAAFWAMRGRPVHNAYYGKFLLTGGAVAAMAGRRWQRPAFADLGESVLLAGLSGDQVTRASSVVRALSGIVCVSERLREEAIDLGAPSDKILLAPNFPDMRRFRPLNRDECRERLGLPPEAFVVLFNGHFIERKGPLRVHAALERTGGAAFGVFLGHGEQKPSGPRVLHAAPVPNAEVPTWLNAADVMVLPTLAEGNCNAIAEALACCLPIITSNIADIRSQVPGDSAILVDPTSIDEIGDALKQLMQQPDRLESMRANMRQRLSRPNPNRGQVILEWMNSIV